LRARVTPLSGKLSLITLFPPLPGFEDFIGVWLYRGAETFLVEVGPSVTAPSLFQALEALEVRSLDFILITHIHIDHAGAAGHLAARFPSTPIVCHGSGLSHLAEPSRLWEGTLKRLGETARAYGPIAPVPRKSLLPAEGFASGLVRCLPTPGHAPHHVSYWSEECLFAGEAAGTYQALPAGRDYLRPATPPRFFFDAYLRSLETLIGLRPQRICYGHFGLKEAPASLLARHREQLFLWKDLIASSLPQARQPGFLADCAERLLAQDPLLQGYPLLEEAARQREMGFIRNSVMGFAGCLERL